jgi:hypothetical protein
MLGNTPAALLVYLQLYNHVTVETQTESAVDGTLVNVEWVEEGMTPRRHIRQIRKEPNESPWTCTSM